MHIYAYLYIANQRVCLTSQTSRGAITIISSFLNSTLRRTRTRHKRLSIPLILNWGIMNALTANQLELMKNSTSQ